jgi:hypothetical protein
VFITMTANPRHPDMLAEPGLHLADGTLNMDIVIRIFAKQIEELKKDIRDRKILGNCLNMISVTEFQKRGLPHVHMVVTLDHGVCICAYSAKVLIRVATNCYIQTYSHCF